MHICHLISGKLTLKFSTGRMLLQPFPLFGYVPYHTLLPVSNGLDSAGFPLIAF